MIVIRRVDPPPDLQPRLLDAPAAPRECEVSSNGQHCRVPTSTYPFDYPGKNNTPFCSWCGQTLPEVENETESNRLNAAIESERTRVKRARSIERIRRRVGRSSVSGKHVSGEPERRGLFDGIDC